VAEVGVCFVFELFRGSVGDGVGVFFRRRLFRSGAGNGAGNGAGGFVGLNGKGRVCLEYDPIFCQGTMAGERECVNADEFCDEKESNPDHFMSFIFGVYQGRSMV